MLLSYTSTTWYHEAFPSTVFPEEAKQHTWLLLFILTKSGATLPVQGGQLCLGIK